MAGAPFPLPPGASVPCRGQCRVVLCGGEGGRGWGGGCGVSPARPGACGHPPALGGEAGEPRGPRVAPQLPVWGGAQCPGPPGVVERCRGQPHQVDPRNGGDLLCSQEGVYSVPRRGRREGGAGYGCCPIEVGGGDPQDPPRVPAGCDDEEEQGGARALLPEDLPPVVGTPGRGERGGQVWVNPAAGRVRRRREGGAPSGLPGERLVDDGVLGGLAWCRRTPDWSAGGGRTPRPRLPRTP